MRNGLKNQTIDELNAQIESLQRWKDEAQIVMKRWEGIEDFMRSDPRLKPGQIISAYILELLRHERMRNATDSFKCPKCGMVSYNRDDIVYKYCGNCHVFWGKEDVKAP